MRDSGVEFLGEVPSHWDVQPAVTLARVLTSTIDKKSHEGEQPVKLCNYTDVYYRDRIVDNSKFMAATATFDQIAKFSVRAGDVPFTKDSETADDIGIPSYVPKDLPGTVYGYHLSIYRPIDKRRGRFLKYLLESDYAKAHFEAKTPGVTRVGLGQATIRYFRAPTPPVEEAVAIADYLDRETARIDKLIAKSEELIGLLTERRISTITSALTSGLQDGPDGLDDRWFGAIPAHWDSMPLRYLLRRIEQGVSPQAEGGLAEGNDQFGVLRSGCVNGGVYRPTEHKLLPTDFDFDRSLIVRPGDLLVNRASGSIPLLGSAALVTESPYQLILSDKTFRLIPSARTTSGYLYWLLNSRIYREQVESSVSGADGLANNLPQSSLRRFVLPVPPREEQERISSYLRGRCAQIDRSIDTARRGVALARERRAALISVAVTGKIDVGVAA